MRQHRRLFIRSEEAAMSRDAAEHWLDQHDPERRPKPATGITLESPLEGVPPRTVKIEEAG
jgi:hypothetical protein